jgi:hypothetical protein
MPHSVTDLTPSAILKRFEQLGSDRASSVMGGRRPPIPQFSRPLSTVAEQTSTKMVAVTGGEGGATFLGLGLHVWFYVALGLAAVGMLGYQLWKYFYANRQDVQCSLPPAARAAEAPESRAEEQQAPPRAPPKQPHTTARPAAQPTQRALQGRTQNKDDFRLLEHLEDDDSEGE